MLLNDVRHAHVTHTTRTADGQVETKEYYTKNIVKVVKRFPPPGGMIVDDDDIPPPAKRKRVEGDKEEQTWPKRPQPLLQVPVPVPVPVPVVVAVPFSFGGPPLATSWQ